jgi:hypothetical protein
MPRHFWGECPSGLRRQDWQQKYKESLPPDEEYLCKSGPFWSVSSMGSSARPLAG